MKIIRLSLMFSIVSLIILAACTDNSTLITEATSANEPESSIETEPGNLPESQPSFEAEPSSLPEPTEPEIMTIPGVVISNSNQFIIFRVGEEFFNQYISFDLSNTRYMEGQQNCQSCAEYLKYPYYYMVYSLKIPDKPFVDELISFPVNIDGKIITEADIEIANCLEQPGECEFPIDEQAAIEIARKAGLEPGLEEWRTNFYWYYGELQTYVWAVENTLKGSRKAEWASGRIIIIDANSGEVLQISGWAMMT